MRNCRFVFTKFAVLGMRFVVNIFVLQFMFIYIGCTAYHAGHFMPIGTPFAVEILRISVTYCSKGAKKRGLYVPV